MTDERNQDETQSKDHMGDISEARTPLPLHEQLLTIVKKVFPDAIDSPVLVGQSMFTVDIDDSPQLGGLIRQAFALQKLPFEEKLASVEQLTIQALPSNSVEMARQGNEIAKSLVYRSHPLSDALKEKSGCCRYQGSLFFALARAAKLGDSHFMMSQRMGESSFTIYNVVYEKAQRHLVSIYNKTLTSEGRQKFGYPEPKYATNDDFARGMLYYAYFNTKYDLLTVRTPLQSAIEMDKWGKSVSAWAASE